MGVDCRFACEELRGRRVGLNARVTISSQPMSIFSVLAHGWAPIVGPLVKNFGAGGNASCSCLGVTAGAMLAPVCSTRPDPKRHLILGIRCRCATDYNKL